ncbi:TfuA domain-containing protein [Jannaschia sp. CCS1]|uniref:TfuA domain-containing protein n=1 Tax=Jannaschia sp. (strain CCS1) TaxID=290400 RepID=UPI0003134598|nr:TfuA domain-containing protein [Jannaschia sp. CCS1]
MTSEPSAIGIVDGYFGTTLSVHQKEILEAMDCGIPVLGAASMGALRAAELAPFGMIGVGGIFEDYRSGRIENDADVAVTHGPAELCYPATSIAMVDIRATLAAMADDYPADLLDRLQGAAESLHFSKRSFDEIARRAGAAPGHTEDLLRAHYVARKRHDARALLDCMEEGDYSLSRTAPPVPMTHEYRKIRSRTLSGVEPVG